MFFNKKAQEEKPEAVILSTDVYSCLDDACNGWMRKEFVSLDLKCPLCGSDTSLEVRDLPEILT